MGKFDIADSKTVSRAVERASAARREWAETDMLERERIVSKFSDILKRRKDEIAELISTEMGKPIIEAEGEIEGALGDMGWLLSETRKIVQDETVELGKKDITARVRFQPVGVVGLITPWNFPIGTPMYKIVPALLVGNTAVFKPSELSTFCGLKIAELLKEAGIPDGVFNVITGDSVTGKLLVESDVDMVSFTGSSAAGKNVLSRGGKKLHKTVLELGGSDPFIVFEDAILEQAVNAAVFGRFLNCGQVCTAAKRIFVQKKIFDSFLESFIKKVRNLKVGNPLDRKTEIGPLVSKKQLERLERQVKDAVKKGVKTNCGGKRIGKKGYFYEPTVLTNITNSMSVFREEVFGPVASLISFETPEEAIGLANATAYGLGASVWTQNNKLAEQVARSVQSGMVWINDFGTPYPQCPQGGIKESGIGREMSRYGILEFCNLKTIVTSKDKSVKKPWWFPYSG